MKILKLFACILFFESLTFICVAQKDTTIQLSTELDNNFLCPDKQEVYLYIDLKACTTGKRVPLNISVVFDRSGSMEGERIHYGKMAIEYLIDQLQPQDIMSIVIYDHEAQVLHASEPVRNKAELKRKLEHIQPRGSTNLSSGLELGVMEVRSTYDTTKINRVFLFSDGLPNEGITDAYILEKIVHSYARKDDVTVSTFGLGHEFNEYLMHDIAEAGGGNYYYIQNPSDAVNDFGQEISALMSVVAQRAKLIIDFPAQNMSVSRVYGYPSTVVNGQIFVDLKEIHPNEQTGLLIKFTLKEAPTAPVVFRSRLSYYSSITQSIAIIEKTNTLTPSPDFDDCSSKYNAAVLEQMVYYTSHYLFESAVKDVENENLSSARKKITQGKQLITESPAQPNSTLLSDQYKLMTDYDKQLSEWNTKSHEHKKHIQKKAHYANYKLRKTKKS